MVEELGRQIFEEMVHAMLRMHPPARDCRVVDGCLVRAAAGQPLDECYWKDDPPRHVRFSGQLRQQEIDRSRPERFEVLPHRRERRARVQRHGHVVVADNGNVLGNPIARSLKRPHQDDGIAIGAGEDRGTGHARLNQAPCGGADAMVEIVGKVEQVRVRLDAVLAERSLVAFVALPHIVGEEVADIGNPAMPVLEQVAHRGHGASDVVRTHVRAIEPGSAVPDGHQRLAGGQESQRIVTIDAVLNTDVGVDALQIVEREIVRRGIGKEVEKRRPSLGDDQPGARFAGGCVDASEHG